MKVCDSVATHSDNEVTHSDSEATHSDNEAKHNIRQLLITMKLQKASCRI